MASSSNIRRFFAKPARPFSFITGVGDRGGTGESGWEMRVSLAAHAASGPISPASPGGELGMSANPATSRDSMIERASQTELDG
eukprot:scaffold122086_cov32-Tisochrysis_lutea.AAC.2